jgi:hypothetical protein
MVRLAAPAVSVAPALLTVWTVDGLLLDPPQATIANEVAARKTIRFVTI